MRIIVGVPVVEVLQFVQQIHKRGDASDRRVAATHRRACCGSTLLSVRRTDTRFYYQYGP